MRPTTTSTSLAITLLLLVRPALAQVTPAPVATTPTVATTTTATTTATATATATAGVVAAPPAARRSLVRGLRINSGMMTIGVARLPGAGWNYVMGYHARLDVLLPARLALGSELGLLAIPPDEQNRGGPDWTAVTVAEHVVYRLRPRVRLSAGAGLVLPSYAPAVAAAVHLRATCFDSSADSPCFWLQARADLVDGVPVLGLAMQLAL